MINKNFQNELFKSEFDVLNHASSLISNEKYKNNELIENLKELVSNYDKLLNLTTKIFKISDAQGRDLKRRENEIKTLLDNSNQGFLTFGKDLLVDREYSSECTRIFGKKIVNVNIVDLISGFNDTQSKLFLQVFRDIFDTDDTDRKLSLILKLPNIIKINDSYISINYKLVNNTEYGVENDTIMLILTDITEKLKAEDQVMYLSFHDKLTSLYNRAYIDSIIPQLQSSSEFPLSIIMADMNGLKLTNDVFGHENGDKLLVNLSQALLKCCRKSDIVARWGGDEFLIILPGTDNAICEKICGRIKSACGESEQVPIELSVSLGTATTDNSSTNISQLFSIAENSMYSNKLIESKSVRKKIILGMEKILHSRCYESFEHIERVKKNAVNLATKCLNLDSESIEVSNLSMLAALHDIGKVAIPKEILGKKGPLTNNEWRIMQSHTEIGFRMAQSIEEPVLAQAILSIRERWDGKGYPYGLKGEQIPLITRIFAIVDAYDVMTHDRPYKEVMGKKEAINELENSSNFQFDPNLVRLFIDNLDSIIY